jgi:putative addiction module component (TIGR02574 family)
MSATVHELEAEVLSLSASERAHLLERLIESFEADSAIQDAWITEALRRESEVLSGKVALVPAEEALMRVRKSIA